MNGNPRLYWGASTVLLVWILAQTIYGAQVERCQANGAIFDLRHWRCDPLKGRILIDRGLKRSRREAPQ